MKAFFVLAILVATVTAQCDNNNGTNGCPVCGEDELTCVDNFAGAITEACPTCIPTLDGSLDNWGNPCWNSCPVFCHEGEQVCGDGVDPWSGCKMSGWCEPTMDTLGCPKSCPPNCGPEEKHCWGGVGGDGCNLPDYCVPVENECGM